MTIVVAADMRQRAGDAGYKPGVAGHSQRAGRTRHPLPQPGFQQAKVIFVPLGRIGLFKLAGMNSANDRGAVVFIEPWPLYGLWCCTHAFANCGKGLTLPVQRACQCSFENNALGVEVLTESNALALPQRT